MLFIFLFCNAALVYVFLKLFKLYKPDASFAAKAAFALFDVCLGFACAFFLPSLLHGSALKTIAAKLSAPASWVSFAIRYLCAAVFIEAAYIALVYFFPMRKDERRKGEARALKLTASILFLTMALFLGFGLLIADNRFPITDQPATVFFTLANLGGEFDLGGVFEIAGAFVLSLSIAASCFAMLRFASYRVIKTRAKKITWNYWAYLAASLCAFAGTGILFYKTACLSDYITLYKYNKREPRRSEFYETEYIVPDIANINFPRQKRNLIFILLESMESSFASKDENGFFDKSLIPNLTRLCQENINFSHSASVPGGGMDAAGAQWTVAAMTAKLAGLPFALFPQTDKRVKARTFDNASEIKQFLPNAVTLTDILCQAGYAMRFLFGSDKSFASRDVLLETHGGVEIRDLHWYIQNGYLPQNYNNGFWGFEDSKLFDFAKQELTELAGGNQPFMLGLLTVDTHSPDGYICELCGSEYSNRIKNVIACSDKQTSEFIDWCKTQEWFANTTIVVTGDHLFMAGDRLFDGAALVQNAGSVDNPRRWIDIFINAPFNKEDLDYGVLFNRKFSSFDIFPTILAAMGCEISGGRLGLGVDLFSGQKTLFERFADEKSLNAELASNNSYYRALAGGKNVFFDGD